VGIGCVILDDLTTTLRSGAMNLDEFAHAAAAVFVYDVELPYPETHGNHAVVFGVSTVTISNAVMDGSLLGTRLMPSTQLCHLVLEEGLREG
jgi:hypothetical protein